MRAWPRPYFFLEVFRQHLQVMHIVHPWCAPIAMRPQEGSSAAYLALARTVHIPYTIYHIPYTIYPIHDRIFNISDFPAKYTVCTPYIYMVLATLSIPGSTKVEACSLFRCFMLIKKNGMGSHAGRMRDKSEDGKQNLCSTHLGVH